MVATIIAQRYAKALLESAVADGAEDRIAGEAHALAVALGDDRDVRRFLTEPLSTPDDKLGVLLSAFPEPPHALLKNFLRTVMENRRERFLPQMLREYLRLSREAHGEVTAELTTAFKLTPAQRGLLERELSKRLDRGVELIPMVDRRIIGGGTLRVEDTVYDGSLRSQLMRLETSLKKEPARKAAPKSPARPVGAGLVPARSKAKKKKAAAPKKKAAKKKKK